MNLHLAFSPLVEPAYFGLLGAAMVLLVLAMVHGRHRAFAARVCFFAVLAGVLLHPVLQQEVRKFLPQKLLVVVDESSSMSLARRTQLAEQAVQDIRKSLTAIEPVVLYTSGEVEGNRKGTHLFAALQRSRVTLPVQQIAGTVLVTDGQVHDVPQVADEVEVFAPINAILTGKRHEFDRKVSVVRAPKYGILGDTVSVTVKIEDTGRSAGGTAELYVTQDGKPHGVYRVPVGEAQEYAFDLAHVGQNVFEFSTDGAEGEVSTVNNRNAVIVNAVRDRMKVLLVSGVPHMGERAWRNLLKSDPAIDLVHFTILRSPMSFDPTPSEEMSLIAFPVDELFEEKIDDFDLIIFDKYVHYRLLNQRYFANIAAFVKNGGSLLVALNSSHMEPFLFETDLADVLPVDSDVARHVQDSSPYLPSVTKDGVRHPVTAGLLTDKAVMEWYSQIRLHAVSGKTLMQGGGAAPLLVIDEVEKGRVAVLTSDNIWLWSKSFETSGMYTTLLRNVAHWLMKEPELEEGFVKAELKGERISVAQRTTEEQGVPLTVQYPDGEEGVLDPEGVKDGWVQYSAAAGQNGLYTFFNAKGRGFLSTGVKDSKEIENITATEAHLAPIVKATRGNTVWYAEGGALTASSLAVSRKAAYSVSHIEARRLLPEWAALALVLLGLVYVWRRESR